MVFRNHWKYFPKLYAIIALNLKKCVKIAVSHSIPIPAVLQSKLTDNIQKLLQYVCGEVCQEKGKRKAHISD